MKVIKAMEDITEFINSALDLTKQMNPNSYDEEVYSDLAEKALKVMTYLKNEQSIIINKDNIIRPLQAKLDEVKANGLDVMLCSTEIIENVIALLKE